MVVGGSLGVLINKLYPASQDKWKQLNSWSVCCFHYDHEIFSEVVPGFYYYVLWNTSAHYYPCKVIDL